LCDMRTTTQSGIPACPIAEPGGKLSGCDMAVASGVLPLRQARFGLSPAQEGLWGPSAVVCCSTLGAISGSLSDILGRKKLLITAAPLFLISALGCALLNSFAHIIWGRIVAGLGVGVASNIVPLYISETAPANKRGRFVTYYQLAVTVGILIAYL